MASRAKWAAGAGAAVVAVGLTVAGIAYVSTNSADAPVREAAGSAAEHRIPENNYVSMTVTNESTQPVTTKMLGRGGAGTVTKLLKPNESVKTVGSGQTSAYQLDVVGTVTHQNGQAINFWGFTPSLGWPSVGFTSASDWDIEGSNWQRFSVGQTTNFTENGRSFTVTRGADLPGTGMNFKIAVR